MKYLKLIAILFLSSTSLMGQWTSLNVNSSSTLTGVYFINEDVGFTCGFNEFYYTENAGLVWESRSSFSDSITIEDVFLVSANNLIAVGHNVFNNKSTVVLSEDLGLSWNEIELPFSSILKDVYFIDNITGYAVGSNGLIIKTTDGGKSWLRVFDAGNKLIQSIHFINPETGIAVGGSPGSSYIIKTTDGGLNWNEVESPAENFLQAVVFVKDELVYAVGWKGEILMSSDCGDNWLLQSSVSISGNLDVQFLDDKVGIIVGGKDDNAVAQKTVDGGMTWVDISPNAFALTKLFLSSSEIAYAIGKDGTVIKLEVNDVLSSTTSSTSRVELSVYPNPASNYIILKSTEEISKVEVFTSNGQLVKTQSLQLFEQRMELDELTPGNYALRISIGERRIIRWINRI